MRSVIVILFLVGGLFFFGIGTLGLFRFKDAMTRIHATSKCDTLGALLCMGALVVHNGFNMLSLKLMIIILFLWITAPTASHLIAKAEMSHRALEDNDKGYERNVKFTNIDEDESYGSN
jgi:multicomponent Na+:H+ antiporter subunit G